MSFLDVTIVNVAFPDLERDFADASRANLSWVLNGGIGSSGCRRHRQCP